MPGVTNTALNDNGERTGRAGRRYLLVTIALLAAGGQCALAQEPTGDWRPGVTLIPYGWLAGFDGTVGIPSGDVDSGGDLMLPKRVDLELDGDLEQIGFMFYAGWRGERWMAFFDSVWAHVSQGADISVTRFLPATDVNVSIDGNVYTLAGGYRLHDWEKTTLSVYAGARYYDVEPSVELSGGLLPQSVSATYSKTWTNAIGGLRLGTRLGESWNLNASADMGFGGSDQSLQAMATLGWQLKSFAVVAGYRYLAVDYESADLLMDIALAGPMLGLSFHF